MTYTNAQWADQNGQHVCIRVDINSVPSCVPLDPGNTDYAAIMRLVEAGELVIADAEAAPAQA